MDRPIDKIFGAERQKARATQTCVGCGKEAKTFKDELSRREYELSLLCQDCQDGVFDSEVED